MNKETIISAIAGFASGLIASLIAPWVKWNIEKKKIKFENKRKLIESWRNTIGNNFDPTTFRETVAYSQMKNYLTDTIKKELDPPDFDNNKPVLHLRSGIGRDSLKDRLLEAVSVIERKWGLI